MDLTLSLDDAGVDEARVPVLGCPAFSFERLTFSLFRNALTVRRSVLLGLQCSFGSGV